jgi:glycosyltransferase involved in cell wall biosynthesis
MSQLGGKMRVVTFPKAYSQGLSGENLIFKEIVKRLERARPATETLVSVVIPTYNSSSRLASCILSLKAQTYSNIEVIIVDNFSEDRTSKIAKHFDVKLLPLRSNLPTARNFGLLHAKGDYVFHLDSDMRLTSEVIEQCVRKCEEGTFSAVSVPEMSIGEGFWGKCISLEKSLDAGDEAIITPRFFRRVVLNSLGGSDESLGAGEDWDLWVRLREKGYKVGFINAYLIHQEVSSLAIYTRKKYRWAKTVYRYLSKHPANALRQWAPIKPRNLWYNRKKILSNPHFFIGALFIKMVKISVGIIGLLAKES